MKKVFLFIFIIASFQNLHSQWYWSNPYPQGNSINTFELYSGKFIGAGDCGTIIITDNNGANWTVSNSVAGIRNNLAAIHCYDENTFYAGFSDNGPSIIKSTNGGLNWFLLSESISTGRVISIQFIDSTNGFCLLHNKLLKTSNGGINWENTSPLVSMPETSDIHFFNKDTGLVSGGDFLFTASTMLRTTNGGLNWVSLLSGYHISKIQFVNKDTGFAYDEDVTFITKNKGVTWDTLGDQNLYSGGPGHFFNSSTGYLLNYGNVYYTTNAGYFWIVDNLGIFGGMDIGFTNQSNGYILADNNNIYSTSNAGSNWTKITGEIGNGTLSLNLGAKYFFDQNTGFVGGNIRTLLKTTNFGETWYEANVPQLWLYTITDLEFIDNNIGYALAPRGSDSRAYILKTTDRGDNWVLKDSLPPTGAPRDIHFINSNLGYILTGGGNIFKTTNSGNNWELHEYIGNASLSHLTFINNTGYMVGYAGSNISKIFKSTNLGNSWNEVAELNPQNISSLYAIDENTLYASGRGLLRSTNGGINWTQVLSGNNSNAIFQKVYFTSTNTGYLSGGVTLKSTDSGVSWHPLYIPTNSTLYNMHFINDNTGIMMGTNASILKTTNGGGEFISNITQTNNYTPDGYLLHQNYPNPFNPSTNISFDIPKSSFVELKVFDITGKLVSTLVNESLSPGSYNFSWDAASLSSGVYFYTLKSESYVSTKKMLLLK